MAHMTQSRSDYGLAFQIKVVKTLGALTALLTMFRFDGSAHQATTHPLSRSLAHSRAVALSFSPSLSPSLSPNGISGLPRLLTHPVRCRANMPHVRQSRSDSGLGYQITYVCLTMCRPLDRSARQATTLSSAQAAPLALSLARPLTLALSITHTLALSLSLSLPLSPNGIRRLPRLLTHLAHCRANMALFGAGSPA